MAIRIRASCYLPAEGVGATLPCLSQSFRCAADPCQSTAPLDPRVNLRKVIIPTDVADPVKYRIEDIMPVLATTFRGTCVVFSAIILVFPWSIVDPGKLSGRSRISLSKAMENIADNFVTKDRQCRLS